MSTDENNIVDTQGTAVDDFLANLKYKKINEFPKLEELTEDDTLIVVDGALQVVGRVTAKELMEWFNDNLKNFICWRPIVEDNTLKWKRDKLDIAPDDLKFTDIMFPMASETENGMIDPDMYLIIQKLIETYDDLATKQLVEEGLDERALKEHSHDQYATNKSLDDLANAIEDADYVTNELLEDLVKSKGFIKIDDIESVSENNDGFMTSEMLSQLLLNTAAIKQLQEDKAESDHTHDQYLEEKQVQSIVENALPRKVSELENDSEYITLKDVKHPKASDTSAGIVMVPDDSAIELNPENQAIDLKSFSVRNMIANSDFSEYVSANNITEFPGWFRYPTDDAAMSIEHAIGSGSLDSCALCHLFNGTGIGQRIKDTEIIPDIVTISFFAYASSAKSINVKLFGITQTFVLTNSWSLYVGKFKNTASSTEMDDILSITGADDTADSVDVYITHIMCQSGPIPTGWCRYQMDVLPIGVLPKAGKDAYGVIKPDGSTIYVDENGVAHASTVIDGKTIALIDDSTDGDPSSTWSSLLISGKFEALTNSINDINTTLTNHDNGIAGLYDTTHEISYDLLNKGVSIKIEEGILYLLGSPIELEDGTYTENILASTEISLPPGAVGDIIKKSVIISDQTSEVNIPSEFNVTTNMVVYYNGLLMEEDINYTISDSKIHAIDFSFAENSVVTFVGSNIGESINLNTTAEQVFLGNSDTFGGKTSVQSGMEYLASQISDIQNNKPISTILTLASTDWNANSQSISASGVTESNDIILCPISSSQEEYMDCDVTCVSQSTDLLTFECANVPKNDLFINVIILRG